MVRALIGKRDAIGAKITLILSDDSKRIALLQPSYSYLASNDPRVHFELGTTDIVSTLEIAWPDGQLERFKVDQVEQVLTLRQGEGEKIAK